MLIVALRLPIDVLAPALLTLKAADISSPSVRR